MNFIESRHKVFKKIKLTGCLESYVLVSEYKLIIQRLVRCESMLVAIKKVTIQKVLISMYSIILQWAGGSSSPAIKGNHSEDFCRTGVINVFLRVLLQWLR